MIASLLFRFARSISGASAVEFAILAGPMALLLFGSLEFGRLYWVRQALQETAIAGARCMGVLQPGCKSGTTYSSSATQAYIKEMARDRGVTLSNSDLTLSPNTTCSGVAGFSSVTINYTFETALPPFVAEALVNGLDLTATACFPNQNA